MPRGCVIAFNWWFYGRCGALRLKEYGH